MQILSNGNVQITNRHTGEKKEVAPGDLPMYKIPYSAYEQLKGQQPNSQDSQMKDIQLRMAKIALDKAESTTDSSSGIKTYPINTGSSVIPTTPVEGTQNVSKKTAADFIKEVDVPENQEEEKINIKQKNTQPLPPIQSKNWLTNMGEGAINAVTGVGKAITSAPARYGKGFGSAIQKTQDIKNKQSMADTDFSIIQQNNEAAKKALAGGNKKGAQALYEANKKIMDRTPDMSKEIQSYRQEIDKSKEDLVKGGVGTAAFFVPGAGTVGGRIAGGALTGGMSGYGASETGQELPSIVGGGLIGGAGAAAIEGVKAAAPYIGKGVRAIGNKFGAGIGKIGEGIEKTGVSAIQSQYDIPRSVSKNVNLNDTVNKLADYGVTNIKDVGKVADIVTGSEGIATRLTRQAIKQAKPINILDVDGVAAELASDPDIPVGQDKKFIEFVTKGLRKIAGKDMASPANPLDTFDLIQTLENKGRGYGQKGIQLTQTDKAMKNAYFQVAEALKDKLFVKGGADAQVSTATQLPEMQKLIQNIGKSYPKIAEDLMNAKTVGEIRSIAAPFVRGNIAADVTEQGATSLGKTIGEQMSGKGVAKWIPSVADPLAPLRAAASTDTANTMAGQAMRGIGKGISNMGNKLSKFSLPNITTKITGALQPLQNAGIAQGVNSLSRQPVQDLQNEQNNKLDNTYKYKSSQNQQNKVYHELPSITQKQSFVTGNSPEYWNNQAQQAAQANDQTSYKNAIDQRDTEIANQARQAPSKEKEGTPLTQIQVALVKGGKRNLEGIKEKFGKADAQGNLTGLDVNGMKKSTLTGGVIDPAYKSMASKVIYAILRPESGATIPDNEMNGYIETYLPTWKDDEATALYKLQDIEQRFADLGIE